MTKRVSLNQLQRLGRRIRRLPLLLQIVIVGGLLLYGGYIVIAGIQPSTGQPGEYPSPIPGFYPVVKVIDGDTLRVSVNGQEATVRLIGVDTPEVADPRQPVQCFGREASNFAKQRMENQQVRLEVDPTQEEQDRYGRLLRYVYLPDGTLINHKIIADGYGHEYTYQIPYQQQELFQQAEREARDNNRGLWSPATCNGDTTQPARD